MKFNLRAIMLVWLCALGNCTTKTHVHKVHNECQFYRTINKRNIACLFFYQEYKDTRKDVCLKNKICSSLSCLERLSRLPWYDDGDCMFVVVNVITDERCALTRSLGVTQLPAYMLFYNSVQFEAPRDNLPV